MRTVTIKGNVGRFDDESPFLVEDGTLDLKFELPQTLGNYYLRVLNSFDGGQNERTIPVPKTGEISLGGLLVGELYLTLKHYIRGEAVSQVKIEPLCIKAVDGETLAYPEIKALEARADAADKELGGLRKTIEDLAKKMESFEKDILTLGKNMGDAGDIFRRQLVTFAAFAWATYQSSFTLNSRELGLLEFLRVIGLDPSGLSPEELASIEKMKEEL